MDILAQLGGIGPLTTGTVLLLVVILILRGDLVPRKIHEEVKADREQWRNAVSLERARADKAAEQIDALIDGQKTVEALVRALQSGVKE